MGRRLSFTALEAVVSVVASLGALWLWQELRDPYSDLRLYVVGPVVDRIREVKAS